MSTEPTPGAMRAARLLCPDIASLVDAGEYHPTMLTNRARTIDEQTALPEMIAALEVAVNVGCLPPWLNTKAFMLLARARAK